MRCACCMGFSANNKAIHSELEVQHICKKCLDYFNDFEGGEGIKRSISEPIGNPARARKVIELRFGLGYKSEQQFTYREIAQILGISHEMVSLIEGEALALLKKRFNDAGIRCSKDLK